VTTQLRHWTSAIHDDGTPAVGASHPPTGRVSPSGGATLFPAATVGVTYVAQCTTQLLNTVAQLAENEALHLSVPPRKPTCHRWCTRPAHDLHLGTPQRGTIRPAFTAMCYPRRAGPVLRRGGRQSFRS